MIRTAFDTFTDLASQFAATPDGLQALAQHPAFVARFPSATAARAHIDLGNGLRAELTASAGWTVRAVAVPAPCPCCRRPATRTQPCPACGAPV